MSMLNITFVIASLLYRCFAKDAIDVVTLPSYILKCKRRCLKHLNVLR